MRFSYDDMRSAFDAGHHDGWRVDFDTWAIEVGLVGPEEVQEHTQPRASIGRWCEEYKVRLLNLNGFPDRDEHDWISEEEFVAGMMNCSVELLSGHTFYTDLMEAEDKGVGL